MILNIKDKEYEIHFGMAFVRALDKKYNTKGAGGSQFGLGLEVAIPKVMSGDTITLAELLYEGTAAEKSRPTQKDIDEYIDNVEDIETLFDEVIDELKKQNATRKRAVKIIESVEKENRKQAQEEAQEK